MTHSTQGAVTPLRQRMIEDMRLSGLSARTQQVYIDGVRGLAAHYKRSPDLITEEEVRSYLLNLCDRGVARGTFKTSHYGIRRPAGAAALRLPVPQHRDRQTRFMILPVPHTANSVIHNYLKNNKRASDPSVLPSASLPSLEFLSADRAARKTRGFKRA
jgi:hypothetical protein